MHVDGDLSMSSNVRPVSAASRHSYIQINHINDFIITNYHHNKTKHAVNCKLLPKSTSLTRARVFTRASGRSRGGGWPQWSNADDAPSFCGSPLNCPYDKQGTSLLLKLLPMKYA